MGRLSGTLHLDATPEAVWRFLANAELRPQWEVGVVAVEEVSGPLEELGATWIEVRKLAGVTMRERFRVTRVEPLRLLEFSGSSPGGGRVVIRERLEPAPAGGTIKTFEADYRLPGGPMGAAVDRLFMHRKLVRDGAVADERIRALVDRG